MTRSSAVSVEANFSKGLITEATAMNYPENSVVETDNCIYGKSGKVIRRYGIDFEENYAIKNFSTMGIMASAGTPNDYYTEIVIKEFDWTTVANSGSVSFLVVQFGDVLTFYNVTSDNNLSANYKSFTVDLATYQVGTYGSDVGQYIAVEECQFASGNGYLYVTHPLCNPFYVSYNSSSDTISHSTISVKVRDFERISDGTTNIDDRPGTLTDAHKYNLYNQGWYITAKHSAGSANVLTKWDADLATFPSNADIWWLYKNASDQFDTGQVDKFAIGNSPAPNGHYIYSAWLSTRDASAGVSGLTEFSAGNNRPSCVAFYSGRVWFAGVKSPTYSSKIYFSRILETISDAGKCYQQNDPTDEKNADLLPIDGGVINIPEINEVLRMVPVAGSLYIFATNGIWKVSAPDNVFKANDYSVSKISNIAVVGRNALVVAEGTPFFWNKSGIYTISIDPSSGGEQVQNLTVDTIQSLIDKIPNESFNFIKGKYNSINKSIHWLYKSTSSTTTINQYQYDKVLILNLVAQNFYPLTISDGTPKVCGLSFPINSNNDELILEEGASVVKYLTCGQIGTAGVWAFTVSQFNNPNFVDWYTYDTVGVDFESYFITGYRVRGDLLRKFQSNYIVIILETQPNSSCFLQGVWDYSNSSYTGRFTSSQQVYTSNTTKDYSRVKRRVRGSGYSLQLKFKSESGKPFSIVGWTTFDTGSNVP